jgi:hypothetical protein
MHETRAGIRSAKERAERVPGLALAMGVILWHSFPLTGRDVPFAAARQHLGQVWVDRFLRSQDSSSRGVGSTTRGFATTSSLEVIASSPGVVGRPAHHPVCHRPDRCGDRAAPAAELLLSTAPIVYVLNCAAGTVQFDIGGTPRGKPHPAMWNGSLWTVLWKVFC